jgi:Cft2 family RNA processing exonuclease
MLVGYQDGDSPGKRLADLAQAGGGSFELPNAAGILEPVPVNAAVGSYKLGAHAGAEDLVDVARQVRPRELMLVHGDMDGQRRFAERMGLRGQATMLAERPWRG